MARALVLCKMTSEMATETARFSRSFYVSRPGEVEASRRATPATCTLMGNARPALRACEASLVQYNGFQWCKMA
jgi:hypothetical protein